LALFFPFIPLKHFSFLFDNIDDFLTQNYK